MPVVLETSRRVVSPSIAPRKSSSEQHAFSLSLSLSFSLSSGDQLCRMLGGLNEARSTFAFNPPESSCLFAPRRSLSL